MIPENRSLTNPALSIKETNEILTLLRSLFKIGGTFTNSDKYSQSVYGKQEEERYISAKFNQALEPYSILLVNDLLNYGEPLYNPRAQASVDKHPGLAPGFTPENESDRYRFTYVTNDSQSFGPNGGTYNFYFLGTHRPHRIRYKRSRDGIPAFGSFVRIGDRLGFTDEKCLSPDPTGPFVAVSNGSVLTQDEPIGTVWAIIHHHQLSYIPWVMTTVIPSGHPFYNSYTAVYPLEGSNTFIVRRVRCEYYNLLTVTGNPDGTVDYPLGYQNINVILENDYYVAINPCGWVPEGTIRRMTLDRGEWYLTQDCIIPPSSSSRSSSSISSSSSSISSISSISSLSSSSSSSSSSDSLSSSSSSQSSSSSVQSSSSSLQSSSSSSGSPQSSSSSSVPFPPLECCYFIWTGDEIGFWSVHDACATAPCDPLNPHCRYNGMPFPDFDGTVDGQIVYGTCEEV